MFYDLGSGSGKVLFAASLCYPFRTCSSPPHAGKGIEFLESLYKTSVELKRKIEEESELIEEQVNDIVDQEYALPTIEIYNEDFETVSPSPRSATGATAPSSS